MTNILLVGCFGKMGQAVARAAAVNSDCQIICGFDVKTDTGLGFPVYTDLKDITENPDVIVDFSHPSSLSSVLEYAVNSHTPAVICTTGLSKEQILLIEDTAAKVPLFFSANMSVGISLIIDLATRAAKLLEDSFNIEIIEKHHNQKLDAPSGTALAIADAISNTVSYNAAYTYDRHSSRNKRNKNEIGIHAVRGGTIVGEHSVLFAGNDEVIEIKHSAASKEVFAVGAVRAAKFLKNKPIGFYNMKDLISEVRQ